MHAALSRITNINELYLLGKYNKAALKVNSLLEKNDDTSTIESALQTQYRKQFDTNANKFKGISHGYSNQITILSNENVRAISIFTLRKQQLSNTPISVGLIYIYIYIIYIYTYIYIYI